MAYQNHKHHNRNHHRWWCPSDEYQVHEPAKEPPHDWHHKGHVAFRTNYEESITEAEPNPRACLAETQTALQRIRHGDHNAFESVDQEAEAFIQLEHRRMQLAKLISMKAAK